MFSVKGFSVVKNISNILRLCHVVPGDQFNIKKLQVLKTFDKTVDPYSKIYIETPMHVRIQPIDLQEHPNGDRLILSLFSDKKQSSSDFAIKHSAKRVDVIGSKDSPSSDAICVIYAPIRASFDIQATGKSCISIAKMHSDDCTLKTDSGSVTLNDVRGKNIQVRSEEGSITCQGTLLAENIDFRTDSNGDVICEHIRANVFKVATGDGNITTESCYSDESHFTTVLGSLNLGNVHRSCMVEILKQGDLKMTGFDGTIKAILKRGNVHLQASKFLNKNSIFVHEAGTVDVRIPESFTEMCLIEVIASKLTMEEDILKHGKLVEDPLHHKFTYGQDNNGEKIDELYVDCRNGTVEIKLSSWKKMLQDKGLKIE